MKRRTFIQAALAAPLAPAMPVAVRDAMAAADARGWRLFKIVTQVEIANPSGVSRAWVPLPYTEPTAWQKPLGTEWIGNAAEMTVVTDGKYGAEMVFAEWKAGASAPLLEVTSRVATRDRQTDFSKPGSAPQEDPARLQLALQPTALIPIDGIVRDTARDIVKGKTTDVEKAHAIYDWIVDNTFRDPKVRGCGWGDIRAMLVTRNLRGKCADLNSLFVGLARSVGVPARTVYGVRVAPSRLGYESLGLGSTNASKGQHCRAEFHAEGLGWVPVDPADVRKVVLEEPPGNLSLDDPKVVAVRKRLFGGWEMNWLAYNTAHDVQLPNADGSMTSDLMRLLGAGGSRIPYLMYPNGETGGKMLDQLSPDSFRYSITAREVEA